MSTSKDGIENMVSCSLVFIWRRGRTTLDLQDGGNYVRPFRQGVSAPRGSGCCPRSPSGSQNPKRGARERFHKTGLQNPGPHLPPAVGGRVAPGRPTE